MIRLVNRVRNNLTIGELRTPCTIKIPIFVYHQLFCGLSLNTNRKQEVCLPYTTHICGSIPIRKQQKIFNGNVKRSIKKVITEYQLVYFIGKYSYFVSTTKCNSCSNAFPHDCVKHWVLDILL